MLFLEAGADKAGHTPFDHAMQFAFVFPQGVLELISPTAMMLNRDGTPTQIFMDS
jgi:hypothetical protein